MGAFPKKAKCVFRGVIFDVYQWQQKMFDGKYETYEALSRPDTVQVIATQGNKILISKESQPVRGSFYTLFGGKQEKNETPLAGAKRELLEETGMVSDDWELVWKYCPSSKIMWKVHIFVARNVKKVQEQQLDSGERIEVKSLSFSQFFDIATSPQCRDRNFSLHLMRMKYREKTLDAFKKKIFKK